MSCLPMDAVLWHGGEAESARQVVPGFSKADREVLLRLLASL